MNIKIPVLQKIDSWEKHLDKQQEEAEELREAIVNVAYLERNNEKNLLHIAEEALDNIEVCIGILDKLGKEIVEKANIEHIKKLEKRGWNFKNVLEIRED